MKSTEIKDIVNSRILKTVKLPIEFENCDNPIIFKLLNSSLEKRHQRKQLLLPNFENTDTVAIFSDYGGESKDSKYYTYSFVFVDYGELGFFSEKMSFIRKKYGMDKPRKERCTLWSDVSLY